MKGCALFRADALQRSYLEGGTRYFPLPRYVISDELQTCVRRIFGALFWASRRTLLHVFPCETNVGGGNNGLRFFAGFSDFARSKRFTPGLL